MERIGIECRSAAYSQGVSLAHFLPEADDGIDPDRMGRRRSARRLRVPLWLHAVGGIRRGAETVEEGCCCGNHFAVGPNAMSNLKPKAGFRPEVQAFEAPWGENLEAAWLVGPSVHGPGEEHGHEHVPQSDLTASGSQAIDPVCGMTVEPDGARAKGLHSTYQGTEHYFCGKGCKLDFDEDPERYLDPSYVPSM